MDVLTDVLDTLELRGWLSSRRELISRWRYDFAESPDCMFHVIIDGGAYVEFEGKTVRLEDGDVVLFPTGCAHSLYDDSGSPLTRVVHLDYNPERQHHIVFAEGEDPERLLLCGAFQLTYPHDFPLLNHLPTLIHISGKNGQVEEGLSDIIQFIARESATRRTGSEVMLRRLTELMFVQVIRLWIVQQAPSSAGWIGALHDPIISNALGLIHQSPAQKWTVQALAEAVALSRSAFSARFTELVGEPPMTYLTRWRMLKATRLLKADVSIPSIAESLGYESEVSFRKAFKREIGMPPAQYRNQQ